MERKKGENNVEENVNNNVNDNIVSEVDTETEVEENTETKPETKKEIMIPKERFDEVNGKYKELASQMEEMKQAKEQMEQMLAEMKEKQEGTQSTIAETTSKLEAQVQNYEAVMNELVQTKLETVPKELHELIPEGLTVEQKLSWLNKAEAKGLFKTQTAKVVVGQPLNHSSEQDKTERMKKMNPLQLLASYYGENR